MYLQDQADNQKEWPRPETVSQWLVNALENHTSTRPINKKKCIRVIYRPVIPADTGYHVDLPIYIQARDWWNGEQTRIGVNGGQGWSEISDPTGLTRWFNKKCRQNAPDKNQLARLVKYIKCWKDQISADQKLPSGIALTVLLAKNYYPDNREDIAFKETIRRSYNDLFASFWSLWETMPGIYNPIVAGNCLTSKLNDSQKRYFKERLGELVDDAKLAIEEVDPGQATRLWQKHLGTRFVAGSNCAKPGNV